MTYDAMILLPPVTSVTPADVEQRLREFFAAHATDLGSVRVTRFNEKVLVRRNHWALYIYYNSSPDVVEESKEIADEHGNDRPDKALIASCDTRLEISSAPDPDMTYFNDYVLIIEQLTDYPGAIAFDSRTGSFL